MNGKIEQRGVLLLGTSGNFWKTVDFQVNYTQTPNVVDVLAVTLASNVDQNSRNQHQLYAINTDNFSIFANYGGTVYSNWIAEGY